jgi:hypothetical protein
MKRNVIFAARDVESRASRDGQGAFAPSRRRGSDEKRRRARHQREAGVAIFKKKQDNGPVALELERADGLARRDRLREKLAGARAALDRAIADRRKSLLESDDTGDTGSQQIMTLGIEHDAIADAVELLDNKIKDLESWLAVERRRAEREGAAAELDDRVRKVVAAVATLRTSAAAVCAALPGVLQLTPHSNQQFGKDLADLFVNVTTTINETLDRARGQVAALKSGDGDARAVVVPAPPPPPAPAPVIERIDVLLIANSCWPENGSMVTGPRWSLRPVPVEIVARVEPLGWVIRRDSEVVRRLLDSQQLMSGGPWHSPAVSDCVDLSTVTRKPPPGSCGRSLGEVDSDEATPARLPHGAVEHIGEAVVGLATASAP